MALKADKDGFLQGDPITIDRGSFGKAIVLWRSIKDDISEIKQSLTGGGSRITRGTTKPVFTDTQVKTVAQSIAERVGAPRRQSVALPQRGPDGRFISSAIKKRVSDVALPQRGAGGRFVGSGKAESVSSSPAADRHNEVSDDSPMDPIRERSRVADFAAEVGESVRGGVSEAMAGTEQVDPALMAAREVGSVVTPLLKPLGSVFSFFRGDKDQEEKDQEVSHGWFKKIHKELKELAERAGVSSSGGGGGGFIKSMPGAALLGGIGAGIAGLASRIFGKGGIAALGKGLLRRLPVIGGLLAGGSAAYSAFGGGDATREERFEGTGRGLGALVGGGIGLLAGPWGAVAGAAIGDIVGSKVGAWLGTVNWGEVGDKISSSWSEATTSIKDKIESGWSSVTSALTQKWGAAKEATSGAVEAGKSAIEGAWDAAKSLIGGGSKGNKAALMSEMQSMSDASERAMFLAQMDHESGGFRSLEENFKYGSADRVMSVSKTARDQGRAAVDAALASGAEAMAELMYGGRLGNTEAGDGYKYRGRGFTQLTGKANYADASQALGIDLVNNPDMAASPEVAAKIARWFWEKSGASGAAKTGDVAGVTRLINGGVNGLQARDAQFRAYSAQTPLSGASSRNQSAAPAIDRMMPSATPSVSTPIGSNDRGAGRTEVTIPLQVGQNVSDRGIAHVVTGGMGGGQ